MVTNEIAERFIEGNFQIQEEDARERRRDLHSMRLMLLGSGHTARVRVNPLPATSAGLAGGLIPGVAAGWALRRWMAGRSAAASGQG